MPSTLWVADIKDEALKQKFFDALSTKSTDPVFKRLRQLAEHKMKGLDASEIGETYDDSNWAYKQADINGQRKALKWLLKLLETN